MPRGWARLELNEPLMEHIVQKIASDWNCLGPHHSLNVRLCMVNVMKELLSFQGVGGCLLELLLD